MIGPERQIPERCPWVVRVTDYSAYYDETNDRIARGAFVVWRGRIRQDELWDGLQTELRKRNDEITARAYVGSFDREYGDCFRPTITRIARKGGGCAYNAPGEYEIDVETPRGDRASYRVFVS